MKFTSFFIVLLSLSSVFIATHASAKIYKWVDEKGNTHYSDSKPENKRIKAETVKLDYATELEEKSYNVNNPKIDIYFDIFDEDVIVMYSTESCGYCRQARQFFNKYKIEFKEFDIEKDSDAKKQFDELNGSKPPLLIVNDNVISNYSSTKIKAALVKPLKYYY
jgi:glutaredoxin